MTITIAQLKAVVREAKNLPEMQGAERISVKKRTQTTAFTTERLSSELQKLPHSAFMLEGVTFLGSDLHDIVSKAARLKGISRAEGSTQDVKNEMIASVLAELSEELKGKITQVANA